MRILVCDTSSSVCSTGVVSDGNMIAKNELDNGRTHSENFMPLVKKSLDDCGLGLSDMDAMGVCVGPGSFTGIRIGVSSCKAMAEVAGIKMISVYSLEVLAANEYKKGMNICSLIDARNNQVYMGIFDENLDKLDEFMADDINVCLEKISGFDNIIFVGNGSLLHRNLIEEKFAGKNVDFSVNNAQCAEGMGIVSMKKAENGDYVEVDELVPVYLRKSQAERLKKN